MHAPQFAHAGGWSSHAATATVAASHQSTAIAYIQKCLRMYVNGKGRARRAEYGWFVGFFAVVMLIASFADVQTYGIDPATGLASTMMFTSLAWLGMICPFVSATSRRAHDLGQSGWLAALAPIPIVGAVVAVILAFIPGQVGDNQYGADPKAGGV